MTYVHIYVSARNFTVCSELNTVCSSSGVNVSGPFERQSVHAWTSLQILKYLFCLVYVADITVTGSDVNAHKYP